jgi:hypothetical protein
LDDPSWTNALDTTHGIFGFKTSVPADINVPASFLMYASSSKPATLVDAFYTATGPIFNEKVVAKVIFTTNEQANTDHLPGFGSIARDKPPNGDICYERAWACWGTKGVKS